MKSSLLLRCLVSIPVVATIGAMVAVACGTFDAAHDVFDSGSVTPAGGGGNATGVGGQTGTGGSGGGTSQCATLECSGACVDPNTDNANCGTCGNACAADQTCQSGTCACTAGRVQCGGSGSACIDTQSDPANCGGCGQPCAANQVCSNGSCATSCGSQTECSGACVDLTNNVDHCGACATACAVSAGETCTNSTCQCSNGQTSCTNGCKDLQTDVANCGTCGKACGSGQTCTGGNCICSSGQTDCSGSCKNLQTDTSNCGGCGTVCGTGQTCNNGTCTGGSSVCDILAAAGNPCVAAHSTTRALYAAYTGPLYQVCRGSFRAGPGSCTSGSTRDIATVGGYADTASQNTFCSGSSCTITKIYDQSPNGNVLEPSPAGGYKRSPDNPASANALSTTLNGHPVYGIVFSPGIGYRTGCSGCTIKTGIGIATGDQPESMYWVTSQRDLIDGCCFDYGNAETTSNDDGNGTMEALYFGAGVVWGTGSGNANGPWVMADLENGLYAGWDGDDQNIATNTPLQYDFVTNVLVGDVASRNNNGGRFALYGADATAGTLKTMYDGIRPAKPGYVPMHKQGSIILGTGGDNSDSAGGRFYEGVMTNGAWSLTTANAVQANIVAARYGK